ncbi:MAG: tRNA 2-thiouridine(34) synthase MnmA, partial [Oscillospiraceae bacterium]|nr:tRNA 2-thiouridine(34) synthase MnmA [Oscillospiraceae bacterium]
GMLRYTAGQRRGLNIALNEPHYVCGKDAERNTVTLCKGEERFVPRVFAYDLTFIYKKEMPNEFRAFVKLRSTAKAAEAMIKIHSGVAEIIFDKPQLPSAPGQTAVIYDGDVVLGAGIVSS